MEFLYVLSGPIAGKPYAKIGITCSPKDRVRTHENAIGHQLTKHMLWSLNDRDQAIEIERTAIASLGQRFPRFRNEWFLTTPEEAASTIETAAKGLGHAIIKSADWGFATTKPNKGKFQVNLMLRITKKMDAAICQVAETYGMPVQTVIRHAALMGLKDIEKNGLVLTQGSVAEKPTP